MRKTVFLIFLFTLSFNLWGNGLELKFNTKIHGKYPEFGSGNEAVYIFYYDTYRYLAEKIDKISKSTPIIQDIVKLGYFPVKVGKSINVNNRLRQMNAAMPEAAVVSFVIKTSWASELETLLHLELTEKTKNREWITKIGDGGHEWFLTTPREIYDIADEYGQVSKSMSIKAKKSILENYHNSRVKITGEDNEGLIIDKIQCDPKYEDSYKQAKREVKEFIKGLDKYKG